MSIPTFYDFVCHKVEPNAPSPTYPTVDKDEFKFILEKLLEVNPEVIFWEPINSRGSNGLRLIDSGIDWADQVMSKKQWSDNFIKQWDYLLFAAESLDCLDKIHIWPDKALQGIVDQERLEYWFNRPTIEKWS